MRSSLFLSRILACAALVVFVVALSGCSSGGAGAPIAPAITLTYTPDPGTGISQVTTADGAGSSAGVAEVEIYVTDVLGVLAAAFTLDYDPAAVAYLDFDLLGSQLGADGATVEPIVQELQAGQLRVGLTRLAATGIDFNGQQLLVRIRFARAGSSGASTLSFSANQLLDPMTPPQPIPGVQWFGGSFQIQ